MGGLERVISGGQTGVDRAALDVALARGIACGGWCPQGRRAEDGPLPARYPLQETPSEAYAQRTEWNVRDSDGTLILTRGRPPAGGTALTAECAARWRRPCLIVDLGEAADPAALAGWLAAHDIRVLNVAGPRERLAPGIYRDATDYLQSALRARRRAAPSS